MEDRNMKKMEKSKVLLNVLCLEDELKDAELLNEMLVDAGYLVNMDIAKKEKEYLSFLKGRNYDIILADYTLPGFDVHVALKLALELQPEVPFICASGTISEDKAVELLKLGATDYVFKDRLGRLAFAVRQALEGKENQKEAKKAEEALKESEEKYRVLFEGSTLGILATDVETHRFLYSNPAICRIFGYSDEEFLRLTISDLHPKDSVDLVISEFESQMRGEKVISSALPCLRKDGTVFYADIAGNSTIINERKCSVGFFVDVTTRKQTEDAVRQSRKELDSLFKASPEMISFIGFDGYFKRLNPAWMKTLGYPMDKLLSLPFIEFVHPDDREATNAEAAKLAEGQRTILFENRYRCNDGSYRWLSWSIIPDTKEKLLYAVARDITERKRTEDAMRESELKFRNYIDYAPHGVFVTDEMGNYVDVNTAASTITGYSKDELLSMKLFELIPEESMEFSARHFEKVIRDGFATGESPFIKKDRSIGYWSVEVVKLSGQRFLGFVVDVTKRKEAEEELKQTNSELENLHNNLDEAVFSVDTIHNKMLHVSIAHETVFGYSQEAFLDNPQLWYEIVVPEDKPIIDAGYSALFSGKNLHHEFRIVHGDGQLRWIEAKMNPTLDMNGKLIRIDGIASNITDRKRKEIELLEKEVQYHNLANSGLALIWTAGTDKLCNYFNESWLKFTGRSLEQELGNGWAEGVHPDDFDSCLKTYITAFDNREKFDMEYRLRHVSGEYRWISDLGTPNYNSNGEFIGYIGHCFDITDHKQAEQELIKAKEHAEESDRLKSSFLANMSHEVRTPLNSIIGFSELLADPYFEEEQKNEFIQSIIMSGNNLLTIISDIMDISKMESGEITIRKKQINAQKFISGIKEQFTFLAEAKNLELKLTLPDNNEETILITDSERLSQIFNNLIGNALKFTSQGQIEIGYHNRGTMTEFYVRDTGIGIPQEYQDKIFERFRQVEDSKTRSYGGNGLGLAITKNLVGLMGGKIRLESEPGKGSTFYFTMPAQSLT